MTDNEDNLAFWVDKDVPPYIRGENPSSDKLIDELTDRLLEEIRNGKFDTKDDTSEH